MSNPNIHEDHVHFDLGVDALANNSEIHEMHDPWIGEPQGMEHHSAPSLSEIHVPTALGKAPDLPGL